MSVEEDVHMMFLILSVGTNSKTLMIQGDTSFSAPSLISPSLECWVLEHFNSINLQSAKRALCTLCIRHTRENVWWNCVQMGFCIIMQIFATTQVVDNLLKV